MSNKSRLCITQAPKIGFQIKKSRTQEDEKFHCKNENIETLLYRSLKTNVKLRETFVTYVTKNIEKYTKHLRRDKPIEKQAEIYKGN